MGCLFWELISGEILFKFNSWVEFYSHLTNPNKEIIPSSILTKLNSFCYSQMILKLLKFMLVRDFKKRPNIFQVEQFFFSCISFENFELSEYIKTNYLLFDENHHKKSFSISSRFDLNIIRNSCNSEQLLKIAENKLKSIKRNNDWYKTILELMKFIQNKIVINNFEFLNLILKICLYYIKHNLTKYDLFEIYLELQNIKKNNETLNQIMYLFDWSILLTVCFYKMITKYSKTIQGTF